MQFCKSNCALNHKVTRSRVKSKDGEERFSPYWSSEESALQRKSNLPRPKAPPKLSISSPGVQRKRREKTNLWSGKSNLTNDLFLCFSVIVSMHLYLTATLVAEFVSRCNLPCDRFCSTHWLNLLERTQQAKVSLSKCQNNQLMAKWIMGVMT